MYVSRPPPPPCLYLMFTISGVTADPFKNQTINKDDIFLILHFSPSSISSPWHKS